MTPRDRAIQCERDWINGICKNDGEALVVLIERALTNHTAALTAALEAAERRVGEAVAAEAERCAAQLEASALAFIEGGASAYGSVLAHEFRKEAALMRARATPAGQGEGGER